MTAPHLTPGPRPYSVSPEQTEHLPFRVRLARHLGDLEQVALLRAEAFGRHLPSIASTLLQPEADDLRDDALVLIAESKASGQVIGAIRLVHNLNGPLPMERDHPLPERFRGRRLMEGRRLSVVAGAQGRSVSAALSKASYEISVHCQIEHFIVRARPPVDKLYKMMRFADALDGQKIYLPHTNNVPHGVYQMDIPRAEAIWRETECPLFAFMALTRHPDIDVHDPVALLRFRTPRTAGTGTPTPQPDQAWA